MVMIKSTTLAVLLGSAALSSAAALPTVNKPEARDESVQKREWKGRLGARGPWRQETDKYLINVDLTGDGKHHNGHGTLLDINTRTLAPEKEDLLRRALKSHMQRTEPVISIGHNSHELPHDPLIDISIATGLAERDERLLDLAARLIMGSGEATQRLSARDNADMAGLEAAAKNAGVTDDQMAAAQNAVDKLSPEQKADVENAVKHAMFSAAVRPGYKRKGPGPSFLFKKSDTVEKIKQGGNVKVIGQEAEQDTGIISTDNGEQHGAPLLAQPTKRSIADEMGGAPGYIDITSPVFNSTAQRLASLVLSTSNGTSENSTFVLNASSSVRTQVFLVPLNSTMTGEPEPKDGEMIKVNLRVPVFVADSATVEPFCATFDPAPDAPEPMTVEPCSEPEDQRSQIFLFDPETGAVKPNWTPDESSQALLASVPDSVSSAAPLPSDSVSSAISASALPSASVSASFSAVDTEPTASVSEMNMMGVPTPLATPTGIETALPSATDAAEPLESADPLSSVIEDATPTSVEDYATVNAVPTELPTSASPADLSSAIPSDLPSAIPTPAVSSVPVEELVTAFAVSHSAAHPTTSAAPKPHSSGNNVTLIFTPQNASVQSKDEEEEEIAPVKSVKEAMAKRELYDDCDDSAEIFAFADPAGSLPAVSSAHVSHRTSSAAPAPTSSSKPKAKSPKLPEDAPVSGKSSSLRLEQDGVHVENMQGLAGRMLVNKRDQKVMMAPGYATAPYE